MTPAKFRLSGQFATDEASHDPSTGQFTAGGHTAAAASHAKSAKAHQARTMDVTSHAGQQKHNHAMELHNVAARKHKEASAAHTTNAPDKMVRSEAASVASKKANFQSGVARAG
jgi:hypothetical protein